MSKYYESFKEDDTIKIYFKLSKKKVKDNHINFIPNKLYTATVEDVGNNLIACRVLDEECNNCYVVAGNMFTSAHLADLASWIIKREKV